jgi:hypothetical protein
MITAFMAFCEAEESAPQVFWFTSILFTFGGSRSRSLTFASGFLQTTALSLLGSGWRVVGDKFATALHAAAKANNSEKHAPQRGATYGC